MKVLATGATGLIGAELVRQAIADEDVDELIVLVSSLPEKNHSFILVTLYTFPAWS